MRSRANEATPLLLGSDSVEEQQVPLNIERVSPHVITDTDTLSWMSEIKFLVEDSAYLSTTYLLQYLYNYTTILVASHLGTEELAAVSIGMVTMNISGYGVFEGMATSLDTLCGQAYGSGNKKLVGVHVQRMIILQMLVSLPIGLLWILSPSIFGLILPQERLPAMAGSFLTISLIGLPGYAAFESGKRFTQAQGNYTAALVVLLICAPIYMALNWVFMFWLHYGVSGAALAAALTTAIRPIILAVYLHIAAPETLQCWPGLSSAAFQNWWPTLRLALPGAAMTLCEWLSFEVLTLSTAQLSTAHLAAQTFLSSACVLIWHIPFAASVVLSTRLGSLIGAGKATTAKQAARMYIIFFAILGLIDGALFLLGLKGLVLNFFVKDEKVSAIIEHTLGIVAAFEFFDAVTCCMHGIFRGLGLQAIAGWATIFSNYCYSVPLALFLELGPPRLGLSRIWISLGSPGWDC